MYADAYNEVVKLLGSGFLFVIIFMGLVVLAMAILVLIAEYKLFKKCGKKGWEALIPYYNSWTFVEISECYWWYFFVIVGNSIFSLTNADGAIAEGLSFIISVASIVVTFQINYNIAKKFKQGTGFAVGMTLLPVVFYPILGFSDKYQVDNNVELSPWGYGDFSHNDKYCSNCGTKLTGNFCTKCGKNGDIDG